MLHDHGRRHRAALRHRINSIRAVQAIYMPGVLLKLAVYRQSLGASAPAGSRPTTSRLSAVEVEKLDLPEHQPLFLPSQLTTPELEGCSAGLADMESNELRRSLQIAIESSS